MSRKVAIFMHGMGSVLELIPSRKKRIGRGIDLSRSVSETLQRDWEVVAKDFRGAYEAVTKDLKDPVTHDA